MYMPFSMLFKAIFMNIIVDNYVDEEKTALSEFLSYIRVLGYLKYIDKKMSL